MIGGVNRIREDKGRKNEKRRIDRPLSLVSKSPFNTKSFRKVFDLNTKYIQE